MKYETNPYLRKVYQEGRADIIEELRHIVQDLPDEWPAPGDVVVIPRLYWLAYLCERPVVEPVKEDY